MTIWEMRYKGESGFSISKDFGKSKAMKVSKDSNMN